jgi:integrase
VGRRWLSASPAEGLKGVGRRRRGKPQLRVDQALRWDGVAFELAVRGGDDCPGALAALLTLYCSLRAGEVMGLQVRDLDAGGTMLWVREAKTEAGRRAVEVPQHLQYLLVSHAGRRPGFELLFGDHHRAWVWHQVARICRLADVPRVGPHSMRGLMPRCRWRAGRRRTRWR